MGEYCVYLHIKEATGEPFYVGRGKGNRAFSKYGRSNHWHNVVNKYGFDVIILEHNLTIDEANQRETYWIKRIGRNDLKLGPLVNFTDGGEGTSGRIISKELSLKLSKPRTKEWKDKISKSTKIRMQNLSNSEIERLKNIGFKKGNVPFNKGIKHSSETKYKMSHSKIGNSFRAKEIIIDGVLYKSIKEASDFLGIKYMTLYQRIKRNKK
jgi:hypothetical protein